MNHKGFTLVELLIAMVVASIVMAAIYAAHRSQTQSYRTQQLVVQMQQNMRAALYLLEREIRMAGYSTDPPAEAGFVQNFGGLTGVVAAHASSGAATDANNIAFTADDNQNGDIEDTTSFEIIAYRFNGANNTLQRWSLVDPAGPVWGWQVAAEQITSLTFTYFDEGDNPITPPLDADDLADIRSVDVRITAIAGDRDMQTTNKIKCRNMGY
ncbi:MAG: prepilin-type N-terminal cleavage/methylation domain-containing protein [Desulfobacterales bacterium]|jgi:type IV pilus assembly protein PilW